MALTKFDKEQLDKDGLYYGEWVQNNMMELRISNKEAMKIAADAATDALLVQLKNNE